MIIAWWMSWQVARNNMSKKYKSNGKKISFRWNENNKICYSLTVIRFACFFMYLKGLASIYGIIQTNMAKYIFWAYTKGAHKKKKRKEQKIILRIWDWIFQYSDFVLCIIQYMYIFLRFSYTKINEMFSKRLFCFYCAVFLLYV